MPQALLPVRSRPLQKAERPRMLMWSQRSRAKIMRASGFSLVEIAVVLVIISILIAMVAVPLATQLDQQRTVETQKQQEIIKEAIYGFAMANGRLPCPATSGGTESLVSAGQCTTDSGFVPGITLGLSGLDSLGFVVDGWRDGQDARRMRYAVRSVSITSGTPAQCTFTPTPLTSVLTTSDRMRTATMDCLSQAAVGMLTVNTTIITGTTCTASVLTTKAPFVIFSLGKNGRTPVTSTDDEFKNLLPNAVTFISNTPTVAASCAGEFDDIVTWGSLNTLFARMVQAGKLP